MPEIDSQADPQLKEHAQAVWSERADFVLQLRIASGDAAWDAANPRYEQLWTRRQGDDLYELCCIPFFIYNLALGDVLRVSIRDGAPLVEEVVSRAGHHTFRAWFGKAFFPVVREQVIADITALPGCLFEWYGTNLLAIDADSDEAANRVAAFLDSAESRGQLRYETGRT
jgi:hypothetical protein